MGSREYSDAIRRLKSNSVESIYLLAGGDAFFEDFFIAEVVGRFLPSGSKRRGFSLDDDRAEQVLAALSAYTLFQERQVIVVRQVQRISGAARDELLSYVRSPDPEKCLIMILEAWEPSKGIHKAVGKLVTVIDVRSPLPDKLRSWAQYYTKQKGYRLEPEALDLLMDLSGDSVGHVVMELEKIFTQLEAGEAVTRGAVEAQVGPDKSYHVWQFQEAVGLRETERSLRVAVSLMEYGAPATRLIAALATLFGQILFVQTGTTSERVYTGLAKTVSRRLTSMSERYSIKEAKLILRKLLAADVSLKSTSVEPDQVVVSTVAAICRGIL
ncbi:MAG: DNA polymerase III subunit delta [Fidelibacterota bacterium]|nr:MAG: DNA polymerase III subunit delta [Candidatus Neomarinimicrobiota bacterium]